MFEALEIDFGISHTIFRNSTHDISELHT